MDIRTALKSQYHAALAMIRQEIERCPDDLWAEGDHPRAFWRLAYHALFYAHYYLQPDHNVWPSWEGRRDDLHDYAPGATPYTKQEMLDYWRVCDAAIDGGVDRLDLEAADCGFPWYHIPKLDHQVMNIRHIQQHAGQLSERLYAAGVDLDWIGAGP